MTHPWSYTNPGTTYHVYTSELTSYEFSAWPFLPDVFFCRVSSLGHVCPKYTIHINTLKYEHRTGSGLFWTNSLRSHSKWLPFRSMGGGPSKQRAQQAELTVQWSEVSTSAAQCVLTVPPRPAEAAGDLKRKGLSCHGWMDHP